MASRASSAEMQAPTECPPALQMTLEESQKRGLVINQEVTERRH